MPDLFVVGLCIFFSISQINSVSRIFEKHPGTASEVRLQNPHLRSAYMNFLLSLIETFCQPPHELSKDDLGQIHVALVSMMYAGFKVDWLEKKLDEVSERKKKEENSAVRLQEMEEQLQHFKQKEFMELKWKWSDMEALVDKEKAEVSSARSRLTFDVIEFHISWEFSSIGVFGFQNKCLLVFGHNI